MTQKEIISDIYSMLPFRYKKNIKKLYLLHPRTGLKFFVELTRLFVSAKFFAKIKQLESVRDLQMHLSHSELAIPPPFIAYEEIEGIVTGGDGAGKRRLNLAEMLEPMHGQRIPALLKDCMDMLRSYKQLEVRNYT